MDIVFVHGLNGDPYKTWTNNEDFFWPKWLINDLPEADLWTVAYDASPTKWKKETISFLKRSQSILEHLKIEGIGSRPVCFVCHSLGGLVIKQILRQSNENNSLGRYCDLYKNTMCITFFATPHSGSELANVLSRLRLFSRTTKLVDYLKCDEGYIKDLFYFFRQTSIPMLSFYETERTPLLKIFAFCKNVPKVNDWLCPIIVSEKSADCGYGESPSPIEENHYNICKFSNNEELHYKKLLSFIRNSMSSAGIPSMQNISLYNAKLSKTDPIIIEIESTINEGNWEESSKLISECEKILDNNTELPNRAEIYFFLAGAEKNRIEGLFNMTSQEKDYTKLKNLIEKAKRANE
ncbi:MAG: hypothetical protein MRK02_07900 [Candidatus Scalindua sp.]|nr:hypothetical protein [Candidatus Scalindua sp.]